MSDKAHFLEQHVPLPSSSRPNPGRARLPENEPFNPSASTQLVGNWLETLGPTTVFAKTVRSASPCCKNTLAVYGRARTLNLEHVLPLPTLYRMESHPPFTRLYFQYVGLDASRRNPFSKAAFEAKRVESVALLREHGIVVLDTGAVQHWAMYCPPGGSEWVALCLDLGRARLIKNRRG